MEEKTPTTVATADRVSGISGKYDEVKVDVGRRDVKYGRSKCQVRIRRDSSLDSGIHHTHSDSDHDEVTDALNSRLCFADCVRLSPVGCSETDNLVEEVYIDGQNPPKIPVDEDGSYSLSSFSDDSLCPVIKKTHEPQFDIISTTQNKTNGCETTIINSNVSSKYVAKERILTDKDLDQALERIDEISNVLPTKKPIDQGQPPNVVVAIDLGTTYSGYAFRYVRHPTDSEIHVMRNCQGEPGLNNQKSPTIILLDPNEKFHSFGCSARDHYHDLEPAEASSWYYFDKFKLMLHTDTNVNRHSMLRASNGHELNALVVFSHALQYFKRKAITELGTHSDRPIVSVQWVITVPAIWTHAAKQFIREAALKAGLFLPERPDRLLIALEPEAAAIWCRGLRAITYTQDTNNNNSQTEECYMVVDCGGGTVDITVHLVNPEDGCLQELYKATGGSCGSLGVDEEFERLLGGIFGFDFMSRLKLERPAAYTELMLSFECRKRNASQHKHSSINISPPYSFIDHFRKVTGKEVEDVIDAYSRPEVKWSSQGCIRLHSSLMAELFKPTVDRVIQHIECVLANHKVAGLVTHLYLVGGFAESQILQQAIRHNFIPRLKVIIPQGVALSVLRGAVLFGLNPKVVSLRQARHTYGIGVLRKFQDGFHPVEKLVIKDGQEWCVDILDPLVRVNQTIRVGEMVMRRYTPATDRQSMIVLHIYCSQSPDAQFVTDDGVHRIGTLKLDISPVDAIKGPREIIARLTFGGTEVTASAFDTASQQYVDTDLSFLV